MKLANVVHCLISDIQTCVVVSGIAMLCLILWYDNSSVKNNTKNSGPEYNSRQAEMTKSTNSLKQRNPQKFIKCTETHFDLNILQSFILKCMFTWFCAAANLNKADRNIESNNNIMN